MVLSAILSDAFYVTETVAFKTRRNEKFKSESTVELCYGIRNPCSSYGRIFVYTFCLITICLSLSDDANKIKTLNIERA